MESQVAVLTERIRNLTEHMKNNHKDEHSKRGLLMMVNRRKKLLAYIKKRNPDEYEDLIHYLYDPYVELGGNGSAEKVMQEIKKLPMKW